MLARFSSKILALKSKVMFCPYCALHVKKFLDNDGYPIDMRHKIDDTEQQHFLRWFPTHMSKGCCIFLVSQYLLNQIIIDNKYAFYSGWPKNLETWNNLEFDKLGKIKNLEFYRKIMEKPGTFF